MFQNMKKIAVYGLGSATQEFLKQRNIREVVIGLLDGYRDSGELYGKPIISLQEAIDEGAEAIVVAARPSSRRIIVNRIREKCEEKHLLLLDIHGNDLSAPVKRGFEGSSENQDITKERLMELIEESEVVSFDIFDTLITRAVLYPTDVFELVEHLLIQKYGQGFSFAKERQEAERRLSRSGVPTILEIYKELQNCMGVSDDILKEMQQVEWQTEKKVMRPRREMCELYRYALQEQKQVFLVSDMYYPAEQLKQLLKDLGISGYQEMLVSCDYKTSKEQELFCILKEKAPAEHYLHIGDDALADIKAAINREMVGIKVKSGLELFEQTGLADMFRKKTVLGDRVKQGMLVAELFNSPFALSWGRFSVKEARELGYLFFAPLLADFILWLKKTVEGLQSKAVLFCARDGYLIKKLYEMVSAGSRKTEAVYFLTSRTSAVSAGVFCEEDIKTVVGQEFHGDRRKLLQTRFLLTEDVLKCLQGQTEKSVALTDERMDMAKWSNVILNHSQELRRNYLEYVRLLKLPEGDIAIFDFVSSGTCHAYLERILGRKLQGCYFIRVDSNEPQKQGLQVNSFYTAQERDLGRLYEDYFIWENIVTSPMPSVKCFDKEGRPQYREESRSKEEIDFILAAQEGIIQYVREYLEFLPEQPVRKESKWCAEDIWSLIREIPVENEIFKKIVWEDDYYARAVSVEELL